MIPKNQERIKKLEKYVTYRTHLNNDIIKEIKTTEKNTIDFVLKLIDEVFGEYYNIECSYCGGTGETLEDNVKVDCRWCEGMGELAVVELSHLQELKDWLKSKDSASPYKPTPKEEK